MTPAEALEHQRKGGKLYEYISPRVTWTFDADAYYAQRGTKVVCFTIPATNPAHEHGGYSKEYHEEALAASRDGRIRWTVL